jgi:hypothetical protein
VALVRFDFSEELIASINRVERISKLESTLADNGEQSSLILVTLMMEAIDSFETSVGTRATLRNIPKDGVLLRS